MIPKSIVCFLAVISLFLFTSTANAATFNPNFVLSDTDLEDTETMTHSDIENFLLRHGSLGILLTPDTDGRMKTAAEIISRIAHTYHLNPQFLIALMQKEQGIVEGRIPTDAHLAWAAGYAVCDHCDRDHPELQPFSGFANQLEQAAKRIREKFLSEIDLTGKTFTGWGPGIKKTLRGTKIIPGNRATAALYTYTPHVAGNRLLWSIWNKWFNQKYFDGALLESDDPKDTRVWLIEFGKRREIIGKATLLSRFDPKKIITVPREELARYEVGLAVRFPDYTILEDPDGDLYLTRGSLRHELASREVFRKIGFSPDEIISVSWQELAGYEEGSSITNDSAYPLGALWQNATNGGVYYIEDGKKNPIWSREILTSRFKDRPIIKKSPTELERFPTGDPVRFSDGELVGEKGTPTVYVISRGLLRPIPSPEIFLSMGWRWEYIVWTNAKALSAHARGEPILLKENMTVAELASTR